MTIHSIAIVDQVEREYRSHVLTEFRACGRFFQAHRPFKDGRRRVLAPGECSSQALGPQRTSVAAAAAGAGGACGVSRGSSTLG
jgi:hypothetical protein